MCLGKDSQQFKTLTIPPHLKEDGVSLSNLMKVLSNQATETLNEKKNDAIMKTIVLCSIIITSIVLIYLRWGGKVWETKKDSL